MHIMLFGGAFDPPHNGHLQIAQAILDQQLADALWFVPCAAHPFGKKMSPSANRLEMLRRATELPISTFEVEKSATSYTIDTIEYFAKRQPNDHFSWLIGSDQLPSFTRWQRWQDLIKNFTVFVYPRQDFPFDQLQAEMVALKQLPLVTISSTLIRELASNNARIDQLVPASVAEYITRHRLYAD